MPTKPILVPARLRRPPTTGWSWVDRGFVREHAAHLSRDAVLLYFVLCAVADQHGLSFYGDATMAAMVRINLPALMAARDELLARNLIAHETRFTQVLSLPPAGQRRHGEPGGGLMQLGESRPESTGVSAIIALRHVPKNVVWRGLLAISRDHAPRSNRARGHAGDGDQRPSDAITSGSEKNSLQRLDNCKRER
jgi:hypothetical protein